MASLYPRGRANSSSGQSRLHHSRDTSNTSASSLQYKSSISPIGKPTAKKRIHNADLVAAIVSLVCLVFAVTAVASESVSWRLGQGTNQLIVVGFLLSIMNLCLGSVAPQLFLLLEARFGQSTLQNYDGILRNQVFASRLSIVWRLVLTIMLGLPIGLSAAYKRFSGRESAVHINPATYTGNASYYGMFAPPGLQSIGETKGITLFFNATLPFAVASTSSTSAISSDIEPPLPTDVQPYGYNVLLLSNESTAMLDMPQPDYVSSIQKLLADGESWSMTASVLATIARYNRSNVEDPEGWNATFMSACEAAVNSSGAYSHQSMMNGWAVELVDAASPGNQSQQYIGLTSDFGIDFLSPCFNFSYYAQLYDVTRQQCEGTWSVTRGGIELVQGSCNNSTIVPEYQVPIIDNSMFLGVFYMSSLMEFLGPFATTRNQSVWKSPYLATATASMLWSRIAAVDTAPLALNQPLVSPQWNHSAANFGHDFTVEQVGLIYAIDDSVAYIRPTLKKSPLLFAVFALQPIMILLILVLSVLLHTTPVDKGFGLMSILSGIDRGSLDGLSGAALSGELTQNVKLIIYPFQDSQKGSIEYRVMSSSTASYNEKLVSNIIYH